VRLFVGIDVGPDVRREAARAIDELKRRVDRVAPRARVSWVRPERLHITVRFIGHVDQPVAARIGAALASPLAVPPFDLVIATTGSFPPRRPPRVLWAGIAAGVDPLRAVEREVAARLDPLVPSDENRPYSPHLTLARIKEPGGMRAADVFEGLEDAVFGVARVGAVTLFESRMSAEPAYVALGRTSLADPR
jgi:2'-5' RNA ligase